MRLLSGACHRTPLSKMVQVMAWYWYEISHYPSQCWARSISPYGITMPQWVDVLNLVYVLTLKVNSNYNKSISSYSLRTWYNFVHHILWYDLALDLLNGFLGHASQVKIQICFSNLQKYLYVTKQESHHYEILCMHQQLSFVVGSYKKRCIRYT